MEHALAHVKPFSIRNLDYIIVSVSNLRNHFNNSLYHINNLNSIRGKISDPNGKIVTPKDIEMINSIAREFFSKILALRVFQRHEVLSTKLEKLWIILQEIYEHDPYRVVECVVSLVEKKISKRLDSDEKIKFRNNQIKKFLTTSKKVNTVTDLIFEHVKKDFQENKIDVLSICGMLLSFSENSQTHLYFVMENLKAAVDILGKNYDIEDIFSIESPVNQNTERVTDIQAIRNAASHGAFNIKFNIERGEYEIDFQSVLSGFAFNRKYTGRQLLDLYSDYDNLRNFQELLIRIALLKAELKVFFIRPQ